VADFNVGKIFSALSIGGKVSTAVGLVGFVVACIFSYNAYRLHLETTRLEQLPEEQRAQQIDEYLTRYKLSGEDFSAEQKFQLIEREMDQRFWMRIIYVGAGAVVFLVALVVVRREGKKPTPGGTPGFTPAEKQVLEYRQDILNLRGTFEARERNPKAAEKVGREGKRLAELLGGIDDELLDEARKIVKYEYHGWAMAMVARVYDLDKEKAKRVEYSDRAIASFRRALELMEDARNGHRRGDAQATQVYEWVTSDSQDLNRTRYLLALALAVNAQAGGEATREQVKAELDQVSDHYLENYPVAAYEPFRWALEGPKGATTAGEGEPAPPEKQEPVPQEGGDGDA
jgi:hypothetical protein